MPADDSKISLREAALIAENASLREQLALLHRARGAEPAPAIVKPGDPLGAERDLRDLAASLEQQVEARTRERDRIWEMSRDMLAVADEHGVLLSANPAWTRVLGWPAEEIVGATSAWIEHPDDQEKTREEIVRLSNGHTTLAFENRLRTTRGDYRLLSWTAVPFEGRMYCVARDVTDDRARETALRDSMDFARLALSAVSGVGVWTYEVASDLFFCDAAISDVYGIDAAIAAQGIKREAFLANVHPDDLAGLRTTMAGGLVRSGDLELEYRIRHPDGSTRWVLSRGHTYFDALGTPVRRTGVGVDMTKQRLLEEQLRQSQKMEAVGQLTGGLAHDFNNLLQGIIGPLELSHRLVSLNRTDGLDRYFDMAMASAQRAAALTHRLLAFSRRQPLDPKPVEVNALVASLNDLLRRTTGERIRVELALDSEPCRTQCDANQLESALLNLSINARDAMPEGGTLSIATSRIAIDARQASNHRGVEAGPYICVAVTDTGTGMPADVISQAFEPFFTTKPLGQGTGLGLSMVYGFAGQSGGFATISSQLAHGTTVRLYLPESDAPAETARKPIRTHADIRAGLGETILVVEDDVSVRQLLVDLFEDAGYQVLQAVDGPSGLAVLQSDTHIDLLVTDVGLPGMNGRQIADAGRLSRPDLHVLFMTGYAELASSATGFLEHGMQMITKPFGIEAIVNRVLGMLATRSGGVRQ